MKTTLKDCTIVLSLPVTQGLLPDRKGNTWRLPRAWNRELFQMVMKKSIFIRSINFTFVILHRVLFYYHCRSACYLIYIVVEKLASHFQSHKTTLADTEFSFIVLNNLTSDFVKMLEKW